MLQHPIKPTTGEESPIFKPTQADGKVTPKSQQGPSFQQGRRHTHLRGTPRRGQAPKGASRTRRQTPTPAIKLD